MPDQPDREPRAAAGQPSHATLIAALITTVLGFCAPVAGSSTLEEMFRSRSQKADYIIVIDRSGSMAPFWDVVMNGTADFVRALPDGDHVSIVLFDREATSTAILPRSVDGSTRAKLDKELRSLPKPTGKASQAFTDLGGALAGVVDEIRRPGAPPLQFVFLFSDFVHEPAAASRYPRDPNAGPWREMARTAELARGDRAVSAFALQLPLGKDVGRDIELVRSILPHLTVAPVVDRAALAEWFARRRAEIQREKLRVLVRQDVSRGWAVEPAGVDALQFKSQLETIPLRFSLDRLTADGLVVVLEERGPIELPPSRSVTVRYRARESASVSGWKKLFDTRAAPVEDVRLGLAGSLELQPAAEIESALQLESRSAFDRVVDVRATVHRGATPLPVQVSLAAGFCLLLVILYRTWIRPPAPVASMVRRVLLTEVHGPYSEEIVLPRSRAREIVIGNGPESEVRSGLTAGPFAVCLASRKPRLFTLTPRRGLYAYAVTGLWSYFLRRRGKEEERPVPTSGTRSIPLGYHSKLVLSVSGRTFQMILRK